VTGRGMPEYIAVALQTLRANPLRTLLSTLGVIIGVGSLVSILSLADGLEAFSREEIAATTDLQMIPVAPVTTDRADGVTLRRRDAARVEDASPAHPAAGCCSSSPRRPGSSLPGYSD
jgi:putative ABC transport system permease protein